MFARTYYNDRLFCKQYFTDGKSLVVRVAAFSVRRGYEGPQIVLNWTPPPDNVSGKIVIVRKIGGYPDNPTDGVVVTEDSTPFDANGAYSDRDIQAGVVYYYKMFVNTEVSNPGSGTFPDFWFSQDYFLHEYFGGEFTSTGGTWVTSDALQGKALPLQTGYFENRMWGLLSQQAQSADGGSANG